ncbi:hypothetical protein [Mycobacterium montefiorense]|uniref:hypothetical protein n=1 Tax=Mycobacterium montefiorense TaxID=154654 RepID=UPI001401C6F1|nr:hypothetical protein [Mycobacterium montefiorense]
MLILSNTSELEVPNTVSENTEELAGSFGDLLTGFALCAQLIRTAQFAHDVLRGIPLPTSHVFHRPFQPDIGPQDSKTGWTHSAETRQLH